MINLITPEQIDEYYANLQSKIDSKKLRSRFILMRHFLYKVSENLIEIYFNDGSQLNITNDPTTYYIEIFTSHFNLNFKSRPGDYYYPFKTLLSYDKKSLNEVKGLILQQMKENK